VLTNGRTRGKTIDINRSMMRLGRKRDCDIVIDDEQVSSHHAQLRVDGTLCRLNDLDSSNGTWLNGERVQGARTLDDGDEIVVGQTKLVYKRV
jgi:pSer/pThr/pTyr-binding forkhead associated (FHA) protein